MLGAELMDQYSEEVVDHLLETGWLHEDEGLLSPGGTAEATIGKRHFLELASVFVSDPLVRVRHGRNAIGEVPDLAASAAYSIDGPPLLLLAGRSWLIKHVDWRRRIAHVEPAESHGKVRFPGVARPLSCELCQSMAAVLAGESVEPVEMTARAAEALEDLTDAMPNGRPGRTLLVQGPNSLRLYTFAGLRSDYVCCSLNRRPVLSDCTIIVQSE